MKNSSKCIARDRIHHFTALSSCRWLHCCDNERAARSKTCIKSNNVTFNTCNEFWWCQFLNNAKDNPNKERHGMVWHGVHRIFWCIKVDGTLYHHRPLNFYIVVLMHSKRALNQHVAYLTKASMLCSIYYAEVHILTHAHVLPFVRFCFRTH